MIEAHTLERLEFPKVRAHLATYATSSLGQDRIGALQPEDDLGAARARLACAGEMLGVRNADEPLPLSGLADIRPQLRLCRIAGAMLGAGDLPPVRHLLRAARVLRAHLAERRETHPHLWGLALPIIPLPVLEEAIERVVDDDGAVLDGASSALALIRRERTQVADVIRRRLGEILAGLPDEVVQERTITFRGGRQVIPIRQSHKGRVPGVVHDVSATGQTAFVEPLVIVELSNRLRSLEADERREVERILLALTAQIGAEAPALDVMVDALSEFDALWALAGYALAVGAIVPELSSTGPTRLVGARHPLLLSDRSAVGGGSSGGRIVPLDAEAGGDWGALVVSGPNAGGKTVALKTVGLLTVMAQAGIPVPAKEGSRIAVYQRVFVDLGDEQSIEEGLSSFSARLARLAGFCQAANGGTLVLLDEVASGTDPDQGAALAIAAIEFLLDRGATLVVTSHQAALKHFAADEARARNASMHYDPATLQPTFVLRMDVPGASYAFDIASRFGLPKAVIERAQTLAASGTREVEALLSRLGPALEDAEAERRALAADREALAARSEAVARDRAAVTKEKRRLATDALDEARRVAADANRRIEAAIREIRERSASREAILGAKETARSVAADIEREVRAAEAEKAAPEGGVKPGDRVRLGRTRATGKVLAVKPSGEVQVQMGGARMWTRLEELELVGEEKTPAQAARNARASASDDLSMEVDLRGMTFDEAMPEVDKYLDDVYLAGLKEVRLIHGKGTGALRAKIGRFLKGHPRVRAHRLGAWNEGDTGVTVVTIAE